MSDLDRARLVINLRGYLVFTTACPHLVGEVIRAVDPDIPELHPVPFQIIAETDRADFLAQQQAAGMPPLPEPSAEVPRHYYRAVTD